MGEDIVYSKKNDSVTVGVDYANKISNSSYVWTEPNLTYLDEIHPLVADEKALKGTVGGALAKVLVAALACACTSTSAYAKYSAEDVISNKSARRCLNV